MPLLRSNKTRGRTVLAGAVVLLAAYALYVAFKKQAVDYFVLEPIDLDYTILANCTVDYPRPLDMSFLRDGIVQTVEVRDGERVAMGRPLVRLDPFDAERNLAISEDSLRSAQIKLENARAEVLPNLREKLAEYKVNLDQAELNRKRYAQLLAAGGVSQADAERAEKEYQRALSQHNQLALELENFSRSGLLADLENQLSIDKARVALARRDLDNTRLNAPFDGTVLKVHVQPGEKVTPADRAVTVLENASWQLGLNVDQREMPFLKTGLPAAATLDAYPGERLAGRVSFVCSEVDKEKNSCEVRVELEGSPAFVRSGMAGRVEILAAKYGQALALPARFATAAGGGSVWVWDGRRAERKKVALKPVGERWVLVEGLAANTIVLDADPAASPRRLKPGREIKADGSR